MFTVTTMMIIYCQKTCNNDHRVRRRRKSNDCCFSCYNNYCTIRYLEVLFLLLRTITHQETNVQSYSFVVTSTNNIKNKTRRIGSTRSDLLFISYFKTRRGRGKYQQPFILYNTNDIQHDVNQGDTTNNNSDSNNDSTVTSTITTTTNIIDDNDSDGTLVSLSSPSLVSSTSTVDAVGAVEQQQQVVKYSNNTERWNGILVLCTVPFIWGTYTPIIKYVSSILHPSIPGILFSTLYYIVGTISLWFLLVVVRNNNNNSIPQPQPKQSSSTPSSLVSSVPNTLYDTNTNNWKGGIELGSYLFIANVFQVIGLQTVAADRAGFLIQLTTIFVPIIEALTVIFVLSSPVSILSPTSTTTTATTIPPTILPLRTWIACFMAFAGVIIFDWHLQDDTIDFTLVQQQLQLPLIFNREIDLVSFVQRLSENVLSIIQSILDQSSLGIGDTYIIVASILYSIHVVRLGRYATACDALTLAACKVTMEAIYSVGLIAFFLFFSNDRIPMIEETNGFMQYLSNTGHEIKSYTSYISSMVGSSNSMDSETLKSLLVPVSAAVLWTAWVTCAYTVFAQSYGQSRVQPTDANLVYSIQPLCTAIFAYVLLGETLSLSGIVGATLIILAVYAIAVGNDDDIV